MDIEEQLRPADALPVDEEAVACLHSLVDRLGWDRVLTGLCRVAEAREDGSALGVLIGARAVVAGREK